MIQNIKVDIIYYKTPTDFEMEFNLSGCCRMRLLTDKAPDRRVMLNQLVRAVSRSKIVILTGALFGDEGIINTCSKAVDRPLVKVDNKAFGIDSNEEIEILKDALPLVNENGIFGGCIVEQGPQTLIILSDNRNIRKSIMQGLIHQYISDVAVGEASEDEGKSTVTVPPIAPVGAVAPIAPEPLVAVSEIAASEAEETELITEEEAEPITEEIFAESELITDEEQTETPCETEILPEDESLAGEIIGEDEDYSEDFAKADKTVAESLDDNGDGLVFEIEGHLSRRNAQKIMYGYATAVDDGKDYVTEDSYEEDNDFSKIPMANPLNLPIIIISIILLIVSALLCYCIFAVPQQAGVSTAEYLREIADTLFL